jgi:hypothetical protein
MDGQGPMSAAQRMPAAIDGRTVPSPIGGRAILAAVAGRSRPTRSITMSHRTTPFGPALASLQALAAAALLSGLVAAPAMAQEADSDAWQKLPNPASRAEIVAAAAAEREAAGKKPADPRYVDQRPPLTRAQVRADLARSKADGSFARLNAEALTYEPAPAPTTVLARH